MTDARRLRLDGAAILGLALAAMLAPTQPLPLPIELRWLGAYVLFIVLPGWLLVRLMVPARPGTELERGILALAAGYSLAVLLGLTLHALFRPIAPWQIAAGGALLVAALAAVGWRASRGDLTPPAPLRGANIGEADIISGAERGEQMTAAPSVSPSSRLHDPLPWLTWPVLLLVTVAGILRLSDLGWSEFQGDEARVVLRAIAALQGADGALAAHRKVPGEILVAYLFAGSLGQIMEAVARLPYAISGVGAVLAFYTLARGLLGGPAALAAGLLLAVNGYFVAFGRILQYDSLAFFLGMAGLICCWRFGRTADAAGLMADSSVRTEDGADGSPEAWGSPVAWAALASLLIAGAALVALGAIFLVLPALVLAWPGLVRHFWPCWPVWSAIRRWPARSWEVLAAWSWPVLPALVAAVLVLGASDPTAGPSGIMSYLGPRFGGERPYWNGALLFQSANHYLSSPYLLVMLSAGAIAVFLGVESSLRTVGARGLLLRLVPALLLAALTWDRPRAAFAFAALLAVGMAFQAAGKLRASNIGLPGNLTLAMRVALAWAAGPLFVHLLLIRVPGTHWREAFPGLILVLAALLAPALVGGPTRLASWSRVVVGGLLGLLIVGSGHYSWVTLVQRQPEYQLTYPDDRHPLDWTARDGRGIGGVFGTVHRHGWKAIGVLSADGVLAGAFATNESPAIAAWYVRRPPGCEGAIDYVFRVDRAPQDRNLSLPVPLPAGYVTRGRVREFGRTTISIQMAPTTTQRYGDINAEAYTARFDQERASVWEPIGELYRADLGLAQGKRSCSPRNQRP